MNVFNKSVTFILNGVVSILVSPIVLMTWICDRAPIVTIAWPKDG